MTAETVTPHTGVTMTQAAIDHTRRQLEKHPDMVGIRLAVAKSGCSGYKYVTEWVREPEEGDIQFPASDEVTVYVRHDDLPVVTGTEIDFVTHGLNAMFEFRNPNATAECGCGESFAVS